MEELIKSLIIPDNTTMEEHSIVVDGGAIIGNHSDLGFGIIADMVIAGEKVKINGNVIAQDDVRIDMWSVITGDVRTKNDAYIGDFVNISGRLVVGYDMDIGKDVKIGGGFQTKGTIVIRNPVPVIIYIFLYLTELIRIGKDEEVEKALNDLFEDDNDEIDQDKLLMIPGGSKIDLDTIKVPDKAVIGSNCRMMGNIRAASLVMGSNNTLFGSIKTINGITVQEHNTIHGNLVSKGNIRVDKNTHILGEIKGSTIIVHEDARVDGAMKAPNGVIITRKVPEEELDTKGILDQVPELPESGESEVAIAKEVTEDKEPESKEVEKKEVEEKEVEKKEVEKKETKIDVKNITKSPTPRKSTPKTSTPRKSTPKTPTPRKSTPKTPTPKTPTPKTSTLKTPTPKTSTPKTPTPKKSTPRKPTPKK
ncbi:MAG: hypothetical protein K8R25_00495 [Methanosarcinales archaeon]|nr:hypothetical protein [Methanosarcinales archaeon]